MTTKSKQIPLPDENEAVSCLVPSREAAVFRTPYTYSANAAASEKVIIIPEGESMTQQQFKDECDINNILKRYQTTGIMPNGTREPMFDDFTQMPDLQEAFAIIQLAEKDFVQNCPAVLRKRFGNDPLEFVNYLNNPENYDEAVKLGLINPREQSPLDVTVPSDTPQSNTEK